MKTQIDIIQNELEFDRPVRFDNQKLYINSSNYNLKKISLENKPKMLVPGFFLNFHNIQNIKKELYYEIELKKLIKNTNVFFYKNFKFKSYFDLDSLKKSPNTDVKIFKIFKSFNLIPFPIFIYKKNNIKLFKKSSLFNFQAIYKQLNKTNVIYRDSINLPIDKRENTMLYLFQDKITNHVHYVIQFKRKNKNIIPNIRIHSSCLTGDLMGSRKCDCGYQLDKSMEYIDKSKGGGFLFYLNQEGRGLGIHNKILSYKLQEMGIDTYEADNILGYSGDERNYSSAIQILKFLKLKNLNLITNNPSKVEALKKNKINIKKRISLKPGLNIFNKKYMETKKILGKHKIQFNN